MFRGLQKITPFENFDDAEQTISDLLQLPVKRVAEYQEFIKELIKYAARAKQDVKGLQKALDMLLGVPIALKILNCSKLSKDIVGISTSLAVSSRM